MDLTIKEITEIKVEIEIKKIDTIKSLYEFLKYFWDVIIQDKFIDNWHIEYLCDELQYLSTFIINREIKPYDLIINIPPGSSKSTITTVMFPVWLWLHDPGIVTLTSSYSASLSVDHSIKSRDIVNSYKFNLLYGRYFKQKFGKNLELKKDKDNKTNWANNFNGERIITSTGGTATGRHSHIILIDDPLNPEQAVSEVERINANRFINQTLSSRKKDKEKTPMILIKQRLHDEDPTGNWLNKNKNIKHICLPAEQSKYIKPIELKEKYINGLLDSIRLNRKILEEAKKDLGSFAYAGQYDQIPSPEEGGIIKKNWFNKISRDEFELKVKSNNPIINFFIDTAYTDKKFNDPTGIITVCKIENDLFIHKAKKYWLNFPELKKELPVFCKNNKYDNRSRLFIEPKASGLSLIQEFKKIKEINIKKIDSPKDSKSTRLYAASATIENGNIWIVNDIWNDEFINEICTFPNAKHDEYVDLIAYSINHYFLHKRITRVFV